MKKLIALLTLLSTVAHAQVIPPGPLPVGVKSSANNTLVDVSASQTLTNKAISGLTNPLTNLPKTRYNVLDYGADPTGTVNSNTAFQNAFNAAIGSGAAAGGATVYIPSDTAGVHSSYQLSATVNLTLNSGASAIRVNIEADPGAVITWTGAASSSIFHAYQWNNSFIRNVQISTNNTAGITVWDIDLPSGVGSSEGLTFQNDTCSFGTGGANICWRTAINGNQGDFSFFNFDNVSVNGAGSGYGDFGFLDLSNNSLNFVWHGGHVYNVGYAYSNNNHGYAGHNGGGGKFFYGFGTSGNALDFEFLAPGSYVVSGGRFENGARFLQSGYSGVASWSENIKVEGVSIEGYTPGDGIVFQTYGGVNLSLDTDEILGGGSDLTAAMATITTNASGLYATLNINNSEIEAPAPFYTANVSGGSSVNVYLKGNQRVDGSDDIIGQFADYSTFGTPGTTTNNNAVAGALGEYWEANCGIATSGASQGFTLASPTVGTWASPPWTSSASVPYGSFACPFYISANAPTGLSTNTTYWAVPINSTTFKVATSAANAMAGTFANATGSSSTANLTSTTYQTGTTTVVAVAALNLTPGDWDCQASPVFVPTSTTSVTLLQSGINSSGTAQGGNGTFSQFVSAADVLDTTTTGNFVQPSPTVRQSLSAITPAYAVANATFTASTMNEAGDFRCRRVR